jgi:tetratricopeptide (TPR) repeat protein
MVAYDQAICHCETIKDKALSYVKKAECYYDYKMFKEAEVFFKKAWLDLDPRYFAFNKGFIHSIYGIVLCELKKYDEAMEMLIDASRRRIRPQNKAFDQSWQIVHVPLQKSTRSL